jgi:type I restriction enzyme R subunit
MALLNNRTGRLNEHGFLTSLEFLKEMLELAKEVVEAEKGVDPVEERDRAKQALTELFNEAKGVNTQHYRRAHRTDIDDIMKKVLFPEWQQTTQGERLVQKELAGHFSNTSSTPTKHCSAGRTATSDNITD